jgi:hypothetical protein
LPSGDRPALEQSLVEHVERGEWLDLAGDEPVDERAMRAWGADRAISATLLRDIVRGVATATPDPRGLRLRGARITGRLDLAFITSAVPVVLNDCVLPEGLNTVDARLPHLDLEGCLIEHPTEVPLIATGLHTTELNLRRVTVSAAAFAAVELLGAELGDLDCWGATITNTAGIALAADDLRVHRKVSLGGGFTATSAAGTGAVELGNAELGDLLCFDATLHSEEGTALNGNNLHVHRQLMLYKGFRASGTGPGGAVDLDGAQLGELDCSDIHVVNLDGPAFSAADVLVHRDVSFRRCQITNGGDGDAVTFDGAELGELACRSVTFHSANDSALRVSNARVRRDLSLRDCVLTGGRMGCALHLEGTHVGGDLSLYEWQLDSADPERRLNVEGLTYTALPVEIPNDRWLRLLRDATPWYAAQPYQYLAAVHRAAGHDSLARRVLMAQRRDQLHRRVLTGRAERAWVRFTGLVLGYGYQPWRALIGLLLVIAAAVTLAVVLGGRGGLAQVADPALGCTVVERVGVGLDLGTPLLSTRTRCDTTTSAAGQVLVVSGWLLRLLAWGFATLFIAGFTSAVRRT